MTFYFTIVIVFLVIVRLRVTTFVTRNCELYSQNCDFKHAVVRNNVRIARYKRANVPSFLTILTFSHNSDFLLFTSHNYFCIHWWKLTSMYISQDPGINENQGGFSESVHLHTCTSTLSNKWNTPFWLNLDEYGSLSVLYYSYFLCKKLKCKGNYSFTHLNQKSHCMHSLLGSFSETSKRCLKQ